MKPKKGLKSKTETRTIRGKVAAEVSRSAKKISKTDMVCRCIVKNKREYATPQNASCLSVFFKSCSLLMLKDIG